jgi:hypothetical protein
MLPARQRPVDRENRQDNQGVARQFPWLGKPGIFRPNRESRSAEPGTVGIFSANYHIDK